MKFLLYGAYGYTGDLITNLAKNYGLEPILAGRNETKLKALSAASGYEYRAFDLSDTTQLEAALAEVDVVLHAAGPFVHTARPMLEACLRTKTHYLDITGEITVFEKAARLGEKAKAQGIMLMPGVGFDVVPTDCLAAHLKQQLPDATSLKLAFGTIGGQFSRGTATTMAEGLGQGSAVRQNGKITKVPLGHKHMTVDFGRKRLFTMTIPWGDVSTAYHTTGIPNIETYTSVHPSTYRYVKLQRYFGWLLRSSLVQNYMKRKINRGPAGPSPEKRARAVSLVWGEVTNEKGEQRRARLEGPEGYTLTAHTSLMITKRVLQGDWKAGFYTPAGCYGEGLILEVDGVKREDI